jgi:predicted small lipoprotein YifL
MARFGLSLMLLLAACGQQLPPAASAEDIQKAVDRADQQLAAAQSAAAARQGI